MGQSKLRILYLRDILLEYTDEDHQLNAEDLIDKLEKNSGERVDRKTIYRDIDSLREYGMDIRQVKGATSGYYVQERDFGLSELKLLVDAVQSSKFISTGRSDALIKRLEKQTSRPKAQLLHRQVYIMDRAKTENDTVLLNVDVIHTAIMSNRKITFQYGEWTVAKKIRLRREGVRYQVSPWALVWDDENYYLVGYDDRSKGIRHYRVDKMVKTMLAKDERTGEQSFREFDLPAYTKKTFGMFGGEDANVCLECADELAGVIIDRFGQSVIMIPGKNGSFRVHVDVAVSPQFFGWAAGIGPRLRIVSPASVADRYRAYLEELLGYYNRSEASDGKQDESRSCMN